MKLRDVLRLPRLGILLGAVAMVVSPLQASAGDQCDAPTVVQDAGADIADLFAFLDPIDITQLVLIATVHPYIVPGQMTNMAASMKTSAIASRSTTIT